MTVILELVAKWKARRHRRKHAEMLERQLLEDSRAVAESIHDFRADYEEKLGFWTQAHQPG